MEPIYRREENIFNSGIDETTKSYMLETARWAKFLAIIGFVMAGLSLIGALFFFISSAGPLAGQLNLPSSMVIFIGGTIYFLVILVSYYPSIKLYRFASRVRPAISTGNPEEMSEAFRNLKSAFKFMGILVLVFIAFYGLLVVFAVIYATMVGL
jgi:hypothetical protein